MIESSLFRESRTARRILLKKSIERFRNILGIVSLLLLAEVMITFSIFQEQYIVLVYFNYVVLIFCAIGLIWGYYYYQISPLWVGAVMTSLHVMIVVLILFFVKWMGLPRYDLLGMVTSAIVGHIFYLYRNNVMSYIMRFNKKH